MTFLIEVYRVLIKESSVPISIYIEVLYLRALCTIFHQLLELIKTELRNGRGKINSAGFSRHDARKNAILPQSYIPSRCRETTDGGRKIQCIIYIAQRQTSRISGAWIKAKLVSV